MKIKPSRDRVSVPLRETRIRSRYGLTVIAVKPVDQEFVYATPDTVMNYSDIILVLGKINDLERFAGEN